MIPMPPLLLVLLCWAKWGSINVIVGNPGHVFYTGLVVSDFVEVFRLSKESLHEVTLKVLYGLI